MGEAGVEVEQGRAEAAERRLCDAGADLAAAVGVVQDPGGHLRRDAVLHHAPHVDAQRGSASVRHRQGDPAGPPEAHPPQLAGQRPGRRSPPAGPRATAAPAAAPPTNWLTAGEPAAAAPPRPTSSSTALSPMSGAPSSGPRPGWYSARPIIGASAMDQPDPGSRPPNVVPLRAIVVTTDEPGTPVAQPVSARAAAMAR